MVYDCPMCKINKSSRVQVQSVTKLEAGLGRLVPARLLVLVLWLFLINYRYNSKTKEITVVNHKDSDNTVGQTTLEANTRD